MLEKINNIITELQAVNKVLNQDQLDSLYGDLLSVEEMESLNQELFKRGMLSEDVSVDIISDDDLEKDIPTSFKPDTLVGMLFLDIKKQGRLLTAEEELRYAKEMQEGDETAREILVNRNLRLVVKIAKEFAANKPKNFFEDFIAEGTRELNKIVIKFDPNYKLRFSTFAYPKIKQAMRRYYQNNSSPIRIPVYLQQELLILKKIINSLNIDSIEVNDVNIYNEWVKLYPDAKISIEKVGELRKYNIQILSFDTDNQDGFSLDDTIGGTEDYSKYAADDAKGIALGNAMAEVLDERELYVLKCVYGFGGENVQSLQKIGDTLDISRERVRQIKEHAVSKLKASKYNKAFEDLE
jgi:RNA polymerase primary sigma factor